MAVAKREFQKRKHAAFIIVLLPLSPLTLAQLGLEGKWWGCNAVWIEGRCKATNPRGM